MGKYGVGNTKYKDKLPNFLQLPSYVAEMTVGDMWEDDLIWKEPQVQPTTFNLRYSRAYTYPFKGLRYNFKTRILEFIGTSIWELPLDRNIAEPVLLLRCCKDVKMKVIQALNEAFIRPQSLGKVKLTVNPFFDI